MIPPNLPKDIASIVRRFRKHKPKTEVQAMELCDVGLRHIGVGSYRHAYQVDDLPLVAKFPYWRKPSARFHAQQEFANLRRLQSHAPMLPYLPQFYYMNEKSGVSLMARYTQLGYDKRTGARVERLSDRLTKLLGIGEDDWDWQIANFGKDAAGQYVLIDLGIISEGDYLS